MIPRYISDKAPEKSREQPISYGKQKATKQTVLIRRQEIVLQ